MIDDFLKLFVKTSVPNSKYTGGRTKTLSVIVIHDMEAPENATTAESVAKWSASRKDIKSSWHVGVDADSAVQSILAKNTAWHAPGANANGFGIEQAGYMRQTRAQWLDSFSLATLDNAARVSAAVCVKYSIPPVKLSVADLKAGKKGFVGHVDVSNAYHKTTHSDPGPNFPWDVFLSKVIGYIKQIKDGGSVTVVSPNVKPPTPSTKIFKQGDSGASVQNWQQKLKNLGYAITVDGDFGPQTVVTVKKFQTDYKISLSGALDAATQKAITLALSKAPVIVKPTPAKPAPAKPAPVKPAPAAKLKVDGVLGATTLKELQKQLAVAQTGRLDGVTVRALQKKVKTRVDGDIGPNTTKALQRFIGVLQDGDWGSGTTTALQRALNAGKFK